MKIASTITILAFTSIFYAFNKPIIKNSLAVKNNKNTKVRLVVDNLHPGTKIPSDFLGLSYENTNLTDTSIFQPNNIKLVNLYSNLGTGVLRLNGYYGNFLTWSGKKRTASMTKDRIYYQKDSLATDDLDHLFNFLRAANWKAIIGLNLMRSSPNATSNEVAYAWANGKDVIKAFEIGNEPDGLFQNSYENYYGSFFKHANAIKTQNQNIPLCGPATVHPEGLFFKKFINKLSDKMKFITYHDYSVGETGLQENINQLLDEKYISRSDAMARSIDLITQQQNANYRVDECSNFGDGGVGVSDKFASSLWGIDYMFTLAKNNALGLNFHGGGSGFTPIIVKKNFPATPNPLYYSMLLFHLASQGNLTPIITNNDVPTFKAYAVLGNNNKLFVTLIDKDPQNDIQVGVSAKSKFSSGEVIKLLAPSVNSAGDAVTLGGASVDRSGKWKAKTIIPVSSQNGIYNVTVAAGSALLLTLTS